MMTANTKRKSKGTQEQAGEPVAQTVARRKSARLSQAGAVGQSSKGRSGDKQRSSREGDDEDDRSDSHRMEAKQMRKSGEDIDAKAGRYPVTPDGHYFVVRDRLWRCTNPNLSDDEKAAATKALMGARRSIAALNRANRRDAGAKKASSAASSTSPAAESTAQMRAARNAVQDAKERLGERGPVWWDQGEVCDRKMVWNTGYKDWYQSRSDGTP